MRSRIDCGMPGPLSSTEKQAWPDPRAECAHLDATIRLLHGERVLAVDQEIGDNLRQMVGVAEHEQRAIREFDVDA